MRVLIDHITPHASFKLNGKHYRLEAIKTLAYSLIKEGNVNDQHLGQFILNWTNNSNKITLQTSGTTSKPTLVTLSKSSFIFSAKATGSFFNLKAEDSSLCCLPFSYIAAKMMFVRAWVLGLELDIIEPSSNPLEHVIKQYVFSAMVPLQVHNSFLKLKQIKILLVGGAPVSEDLANRLKGQQSAVFETFGMTETVSHIAAKNLSVGEEAFTVFPNISIGINENHCLMVQAPKLTSKVLLTNDVVSLASKDSFVWLGRYDNVINSGGLKIHPEQLERILQRQIKSRFFITSIPDKVLGQRVILIVEGNPDDQKIDLNAIESKMRPKAIYYTPNFFETTSGKIKRKATLISLNLYDS